MTESTIPPSLAEARVFVEAQRLRDPTAEALGIRLIEVEPGYVLIDQPVTSAMLNADAIVHGGYLFLLADTAFAYCCTSLNRPSVTRSAEISFIAPGRAESRLIARARVRVSYGRNTICDISVRSEHGRVLAELRGHGTTSPSVTIASEPTGSSSASGENNHRES